MSRGTHASIHRAPFETLEARRFFSLTTAATDAYVYGLAPVVANISEQIATDVATPNPATAQAPINQFANSPAFPPSGNGLIVRPNADTLYSTAWLDLSKGPVVLQTPATGGTFDLFQFLDAYTNTFGGIGTRTTGNGAQSVLVAGPTWTGVVPQGLTLIKAPTNTVWIIGRIATQNDASGNPEYAPVHALQSQLSLTPVASYVPGQTYTPPTAPVATLPAYINPTKTADQNLLALSAQNFFTILSQVLKVNPPPAADTPLIQELANFNLAPGQHFNWNTLSSDQQTALTNGELLGERRALVTDVANGVGVTAVTSTNWTERLQDGQIGNYGTNYDARAVIGYGGLGANLPEDAIYPSTSVDSNGAALSGANNYTIHFAANNLPPAGAFWSLTVYDSNGYFVSNPINRYSTGSLHAGLQFNPDGSLDIYLQNTDPGGSKTSNWLPTPTGAFNLSLRLYDPSRSALSGTWVPPAVVSAQQAALNSAAASGYEYGYALVAQDLLEQIDTNVANPTGSFAPVNQLASPPLADLTSNGGPNADTLYSFGWLDLTNGPIVVHVPDDSSNRFYGIQLVDGWSDTFSVIGLQHTGNAAGDYAIVGPNFTGTLPAGVTAINSPTNVVQVIGRTLVTGPNDLSAAQAFRAGISLTPLANYGTSYTPPANVPTNPAINTTTPVLAQVAALNGQQFYQALATDLQGAPPQSGDTAEVAQLATLGVVPGQALNLASLSAGQLAAINGTTTVGSTPGTGTVKVGQDAGAYAAKITKANGWIYLPPDIGNYGTNYADRAGATRAGVGVSLIPSNLPADAIYPSTTSDSNGNTLNGASNNYQITFPAGDLPPANYFWSLTLYQETVGAGGTFNDTLYPNSINRYEIGNRTPYNLNADGSLTIYVQNTDPGGTESANWLPAPTGTFRLILRLYGPQSQALPPNPTWTPPPVLTTQQVALNAAAISAYTYLYPLVNQYYTEQVQTDATAPNGDLSIAPVNQLFNNSLAPLFNSTGPNADTLYTGGWLDLSGGPVVLHLPDYAGQDVHGHTVDRYYSFELADAWTNTFSVLGTPTTGDAAGDFAIVPPGWTGTLPQGVTEIQSPTDLVTLLGRTLVYGNSDLSTADSYRQQITLTPLQGNTPITTPALSSIDSVTPIAQQIAQLSGSQFFTLAARLLQTNPELAADAGTSALASLGQISLAPGSFSTGSLSVGQLAAVQQAPGVATPQIGADAYAFETSGSRYGFWQGVKSDVANFGTNYADRAGAAYTGAFVLTNPPAEALYLSTEVDSTGNYLVGSNDYELTFPAGELPPAQYFWSLTLYQPNGELYPNSSNIYEIGNRSTGLGGTSTYQLNGDGSLTIYLGNTPPPTAVQSNWIPAPNGAFILTLRIYGPEQSVVSGGWTPPPAVNTSYASAAALVVTSDAPVQSGIFSVGASITADSLLYSQQNALDS